MNISRISRKDVKRDLQNSRNLNKSTKTSRMFNKSVSKENTLHKSTVVNEEPGIGTKQQTSTIELPQKASKTGKLNAIPIRHTLTSKLRMEKANPLLTIKSATGHNEPSLSQVTETPIRRSTFQPGILHTKQKLDFKCTGPVSESRSTLKKNILGKERQSISSRLFNEKTSKMISSQLKTKPSSVQAGTVPKSSQIQTMVKNMRSTMSCKSNYLTVQSKANVKPVANISSKPKPQCNSTMKAPESKKPAAKSTILGVHIPSSLSNTSIKTGAKKPPLKSILRRSSSVGDLLKRNVKSEQSSVLCGIENRPSSTKSLNKSIKSVAFYSPLHNTFSSPTITNTPPPSVLRKRLEEWLAKRGKSSYSYNHLCCFGLPKTDVINITKDIQKQGESRLDETITLESSDSTVILSHSPDKENQIDFENALPNGSSTPEHENTFDMEDKENCSSAAHPEALKDLMKLVYSGYPRDQCEQWLGIICKSHPKVKELPHYWECLAALEEARGDFSSAVDCYGKAIVKGADADIVDERLDELWEKFSALSMKAAQSKRTPTKKMTVDPKQIFKSTVIKFALQQKAVKKFSKETGVSIPSVSYIVTPVRRSSRRSQSQFRSTQTVTCVDTLDDLETNVRETMEFHGNAVLNPGI